MIRTIQQLIPQKFNGFILLVTGLFLSGMMSFSLHAKTISMIGANAHYSFISSYYSIDAGNFKTKAHSSRSDGLGAGLFFDYTYAPYSGIKINASIFPSWQTDDSLLNYDVKKMEIDLSGITRNSTKELGNLLNADYIMIGAVTDYNSYSSTKQLFYIFEWLQITYTVGVTARIIDVSTGEVIWVGSATDQSYSFQEGVEETVKTLYNTLQ